MKHAWEAVQGVVYFLIFFFIVGLLTILGSHGIGGDYGTIIGLLIGLVFGIAFILRAS